MNSNVILSPILYLQLANSETLAAKLRPLEQIRDQYPKMVLMLGDSEISDHKGIEVLKAGEFLRDCG